MHFLLQVMQGFLAQGFERGIDADHARHHDRQAGGDEKSEIDSGGQPFEAGEDVHGWTSGCSGLAKRFRQRRFWSLSKACVNGSDCWRMVIAHVGGDGWRAAIERTPDCQKTRFAPRCMAATGRQHSLTTGRFGASKLLHRDSSISTLPASVTIASTPASASVPSRSGIGDIGRVKVGAGDTANYAS